MGRRTRDEEARQALERLQQAKACKQSHKLQDQPHITASCALLGNRYGVGIGLYFQIIAWLRWMLLWLAICMVPFMIVVNTSRFTTEQHKGASGGSGVATLPSFNILQSLTFAAMPDDEVDKGVLSWMNIQLPGFEGVFPMPRAFFLTWISFMDAGSMAVFSIACLVLYKLASRFAKAVDKATMEVADYTVVIKGLPETTPIDIGHHFSKWGRVMDVVMVKDFGPLLNLAATATSLEQQRKAVQDKRVHSRKAAARQHKIRKMERKMVAFMEQANKQLDSSGFVMKAAFVTFNTESKAAACLAACPRRWISSWVQRRRDRFLGKYRYWVEQAQPPEDYIYENLSVPRISRYIRMGIVRLVVFAILLATAGAVTKLMAMNMEATRTVVWDNASMDGMINLNTRVYPLSTTEAALAPAAANATLARVAAAVGQEAADQLAANAYGHVAYCSVNLEQTCSTGLGRLLGANVSLHAAEGATWADSTEALLKRELFLKQLAGCSKPGSGCTDLAMCYPCHCSMLSKVAPAKVADSDWVLAMRQECSGFIQTLDMHAYVMKGLISGVIVLLNFVLKYILQLLVEFEKHWTQSDKERAYAVLAFVSQLLNSVLVLLLVNAQSSIASAAINGALSNGAASRYTSWGSNLILSGAYTDFSPSWYVDVGQSLQLLIIINAVVTGGFTFAMWLKRKLHQCCLVSCVKGASQSAWNAAWIGMQFVLDARVSDMMLGLWIILMFGSGIPSLYIWGLIWLCVVEVSDRWSLARICQTPSRYGKSLPFLLLGVLPWAAATHCAFGLWMHTRFYAGHMGGEQINGLASSAGANAEALADTYYFQRVTQINGLPLLVLLIVHLAIHVFIRFMLYFFGKAFMTVCGCCCAKDDDSVRPEDEVTYEAALLARYAHTSGAPGGAKGGRSHSISTSSVALAGVPTYRLPHHPRYSEIFSNPLYKPVWFKAFGRLRYTTLLSRPGGGFIIAPEPILDHDQSDMEHSLSSVSSDLQAMALRMADDNSVEAIGKRKRHSGLLSADLQAMRERSMTVQVAVLAGLGIDSPRGSFTGPTGPMSGRHKSLELPGRQAPSPSAGSFSLMTAPTAPGGGSFSLMTAPAEASQGSFNLLAAPLVAAPSGGSFSMPAPAGTPGKSRLSCPGEEQAAGVYAAVAADLAGAAAFDPRSAPNLLEPGSLSRYEPHDTLMPTPGQQQCWPSPHHPAEAAACPAAFAVGADGSRVPLVPVALPGGGMAYYLADSLPPGAMTAAAPVPPEPSVTLSGGIGPALVDVQLPTPAPQQQQQVGLEFQPQLSLPEVAASASQPEVGMTEGLRQQATLQSRAEAVFGQAFCPPVPSPTTEVHAGDSTRSSAAWSFAMALPLPPTNLLTEQQQQPQQQQQHVEPCPMTAGIFSGVADSGAQLDAATAAATAPAGQLAATATAVGSEAVVGVAQEPGWMGCTKDSALQSCHLWDGVLAASTPQQAAGPGSSQQATAAQPLDPACEPQPAHLPGPVAGATAGGLAFYPAIHLAFAEPPAAYPNVHLTTVELPVGFAAPAAVDASGSSFSSALLASTRAAQVGPRPELQHHQQEQCQPQQLMLQPLAQQQAAAMWVHGFTAAAGAAPTGLQGAAPEAPGNNTASAPPAAPVPMGSSQQPQPAEAGVLLTVGATAVDVGVNTGAGVAAGSTDVSVEWEEAAAAAAAAACTQGYEAEHTSSSEDEGGSDAELSSPRHGAAAALDGGGERAESQGGGRQGGSKKKKHKKAKKGKKGRRS